MITLAVGSDAGPGPSASLVTRRSKMSSVHVFRSRASRVGHTLAVAGLLAVVMGLTLGALAGARVRLGAAGAARQDGSLGASRGYTEPTAASTVTATATETATISPTRVATATGTVTTTPVATATSTVTPTATPSPTASATPPPTRTPTPSPTVPPRPAYLPVAVNDATCVPSGFYSDIVFVLDVSRYMKQEVEGRLSEAWAKDWLRLTVERIDMEHARIGLVHFNRDVGIVQHLTNDRQAMLRAIDARPPRDNSSTRMDVALHVAGNMLAGDEATPGNRKVIYFISLMQAKGVPWEHIPGCVETSGEECAVVFAAHQVKNGPVPVTIYSLATSWYGNGVLKGVASDPGKNYLLPTDEDLGRISGEIQTAKLCPPSLFWPYPGR